MQNWIQEIVPIIKSCKGLAAAKIIETRAADLDRAAVFVADADKHGLSARLVDALEYKYTVQFMEALAARLLEVQPRLGGRALSGTFGKRLALRAQELREDQGVNFETLPKLPFEKVARLSQRHMLPESTLDNVAGRYRLSRMSQITPPAGSSGHHPPRSRP